MSQRWDQNGDVLNERQFPTPKGAAASKGRADSGASNLGRLSHRLLVAEAECPFLPWHDPLNSRAEWIAGVPGHASLSRACLPGVGSPLPRTSSSFAPIGRPTSPARFRLEVPSDLPAFAPLSLATRRGNIIRMCTEHLKELAASPDRRFRLYPQRPDRQDVNAPRSNFARFAIERPAPEQCREPGRTVSDFFRIGSSRFLMFALVPGASSAALATDFSDRFELGTHGAAESVGRILKLTFHFPGSDVLYIL
jgi:hypothetical protein